ncbi:MAG: KR domain-containing protein, partial [Niveispirillum sp.]|nr:KR domain-containing protein [Niveispirillum sp.]
MASADLLLAELETPGNDPWIAYRGRDRLVHSFDPVTLDPTGGAVRQLRRHGVYLITGGLGGVGLNLALYLAQSVQARLVLIGRSAFPDRSLWDRWLVDHPADDKTSRKIGQLRQIEASGGQVLLIA